MIKWKGDTFTIRPYGEKLVFGRAWSLEGEFWCIAIRLHKNLELLARVAQ